MLQIPELGMFQEGKGRLRFAGRILRIEVQKARSKHKPKHELLDRGCERHMFREAEDKR